VCAAVCSSAVGSGYSAATAGLQCSYSAATAGLQQGYSRATVAVSTVECTQSEYTEYCTECGLQCGCCGYTVRQWHSSTVEQ